MKVYLHTFYPMIVTILIGCSDEAVVKKAADRQDLSGHARMVAKLDDIRREMEIESEYFGTGQLIRLEDNVTVQSGQEDKNHLIVALANLAMFENVLGQNKSAVEHMEQAYELSLTAQNRVPAEVANAVVFGLALANLRWGETENCIHCQTGESCILPIRGTGIHKHQTGSRGAINNFTKVLEHDPRNVTARWLLNIASMTVGEYPGGVPEEFLVPPEVFASEEDFPRFANVGSGTGADTFGLAGGSAVEDFDGDGWLDIVNSDWNPSGQLRFLRNRGDGRFEDLTESAGLIGIVGGLNIVHADYDNDGDFDVLVLRGAWLEENGRHPMSLLQNDGKGCFRDVTFESGLGEVHYPRISAAWADYDNDGDLDVYVGNEGYPSQLFQNDGAGKFVDVAEQAGVENGGFAKGVAWGDFNGDRLPDLYVANMRSSNRLYKNLGDGTFADVATEAGVVGPLWSFPTWFWDYNNDGILDIWVGSYDGDVEDVASEYLGLPHDDGPACFYRGNGDGTFRDATQELGFTRVALAMGCDFGDLDNDGYPDFYLGTGNPFFETLVPNLVFHNQQGKRFADVTTASGMGHLQKGHSVAFADFDHDGDQDVFADLGGANLGDGFRNALFENPGFDNHWIKLRLIGTRSNRCAIGARIKVTIEDDGKVRSVYKWVDNGSSFGGSPFRQEIGLGRATKIKSIEIFWPTSNQTQVFYDVAIDQLLEITEGDDKARVILLHCFVFSRPTEKPNAKAPALSTID